MDERATKRVRTGDLETDPEPITEPELDPAAVAAAQCLRKHGYAVIDVMDEKTRLDVLSAFKSSLEAFPEYRRSVKDPTRTPEGTPIVYVAGGFGGLGNPSSFHSEFARWKRGAGLASVAPVLRAYKALSPPSEWDSARTRLYNPKARRVCVGMDRDMVRSAGTSVTPESFHRDDSPAANLREGDEVFGSLTNISDCVMKFGCVPGTHVDLAPWRAVGGFAPIAPESPEYASFKARAVEVPYAPGQTILFFQHLVHFIWAAPKGRPTTYRLTQALWLTDYDTAPFDYADVIRTQGVPRIKSGQVPPMYAANHGSCFLKKPFTLVTGYKDTLPGWSAKTFKPCMLRDMVHGTTGEKYVCARRFASSLADMGLPLYPDYSPEDVAILQPGTSFAVTTFAGHRVTARI